MLDQLSRPSLKILLAALAAIALITSACSEPEESVDGSSDATNEPTAGEVIPSGGDGKTVLSAYQGAEWFNGAVPEPTAADTSKEPIKIGFMNVDSGPVGAMPELHTSTDGAAEFINKELGGVEGRPIEIVPCILSNALAPEEATGCARTLVAADVVAVLGGIGLSNGPALAIFEENGIPWVSGIPVNEDEMASPVSFQFSGGSPGAFAGFAEQAVGVDGAERVAVLYADYPSIKFAAEKYGAEVAEGLGAEVATVQYPLISQDFAGPVQKTLESDPQAIIAAAADLACEPIMRALIDLETTATVYMVGSCAEPTIVERIGSEKLAGFRFNIENRLDQTIDSLADTEIYSDAMAMYVPGTSATSAATVSFKGAMNLWAILDEIGAETSSEKILAAFKATENQPSFDGHEYDCANVQISGYPALCAPQQIIAELTADGGFEEASDGWIDTPEVIAKTVG